MTKGDMGIAFSCDVEPIRLVELAGVPVRGQQRDHDVLVGRDRGVADLYCSGAVSGGRQVDRAVEAQEFFYRTWCQRRVATQCVELVWIAQQGQNRIADQ